jgi:hypothetical protein
VAHNPVGHFFNSLHLWSVELFMAFMVIAIYMTGLATLLLLGVPFVPGLRDDIPRWVPVHRLVWRNWNTGLPEKEDSTEA